MSLNIPQYYKEVSSRLNRILDTVGLGDDIRWKRINMWIQSEELLSVSFEIRYHFFGSQAEATTTPGLQSDMDSVICESCRVLKDREIWMPGIPTFLIASDENTPPGYAKLEKVNSHRAWPVYNRYDEWLNLDRRGRFVLCNDHHDIKRHDDNCHGPATTSYYGDITADYVFGMRLHAWPDQASQWLTRNRRHDWPSHQTIRLIQETGALLVPVGHKFSQEQHIEWRISISYGEKILVWLFNSTQYRCYILLKMINKSLIKPVVGDNVLSSYHCKTCMFYLIENTPTSIWQPDNLLLCVELCLRLLYNWTESGFCPNYFIPEENMFQCKVYGHVQDQLLCVLGDLLRLEGRYLVGISCDNIGHKLVRNCQIPLIERELQCQDVTRILMTSVRCLFTNLEAAVEFNLKKDSSFETHKLDRYIVRHEPRRSIHNFLWKMHCSFLGSKLASKTLSEETPDQNSLDMAHELLLWGSSSDVASGKLKLAAFHLVQDNFDMSKDVFSEIHKTFNFKITRKGVFSFHTLQAILSENLPTTQLISQYFALPVLYHTSEINCTPKALIPEMFYSTGSDQDNPVKKLFETFVRIDPDVYLYFLEFLCFHRLNSRSHEKAALYNMILIIRDEHIQFEDTALNLLAYCLAQEGRMTIAYSILCRSMKMIKEHNGAKWQIATLINAAFRFLRGG
ncbi:hypothetical protein CHS0354_039561 [Potamilus streckersoni]|uniref:Mab-21-like HhH/H2TH-like domain-containing protein n=1 Tax=Potamilus streckersoni TaxID=2493646 RepID=A0AAE0SV27_9BIVA|nr:hypothetical protein CHS0354_039561 [Potamilus streckersoni]